MHRKEQRPATRQARMETHFGFSAWKALEPPLNCHVAHAGRASVKLIEPRTDALALVRGMMYDSP
eukprot:12430053-Karenia_brevis.AAC.1